MVQTPSPYTAPLSQDNAYGVPPVSVGNWLITLLVLMIPVVNLVMLLVWAFSGGTNPSKANFCKATLLTYLIVIVLILVLAILLPMFTPPVAAQ